MRSKMPSTRELRSSRENAYARRTHCWQRPRRHGRDLLDFFGANIGESIVVVANGGRARLTRDVAAITMDFDNIEGLAVHALGGADLVIVDDLTGTDVKTVDIDLNLLGGGDAQRDTIVTNGTTKRDVVSVSRSISDVLVAASRLSCASPAARGRTTCCWFRPSAATTTSRSHPTFPR
jgi:hypothetical protein